MKTKEVSIKLVSIQSDGVNSDKTEIFSQGKYKKTADGYVISYEETELTGYKDCTSYITVYNDGKRVDLERKGPTSANLIIELNKRNHAHYRIREGSIMFGICGKEISSELNDNGGKLTFKYVLDANSQYIGDYCINLEVDEKEV